MHVREMRECSLREGGGRGIPHEGGERCEGVRGGRQRMGLAVTHHLQAMLGLAQEPVGIVEHFDRVAWQVATSGFGAKRCQRAGRPQGRRPAAPDQLQRLGAEFDLADAALAEFQVVAEQPRLRRAAGAERGALMRVDAPLHRGDIGNGGEIEVPAPDEGRMVSRNRRPSAISPATGRALIMAARSQVWPWLS